MIAAGATAYGVTAVLANPDGARSFAIHENCVDQLEALGLIPVLMGPATTDPNQQCALKSCAKPLGAEV